MGLFLPWCGIRRTITTSTSKTLCLYHNRFVVFITGLILPSCGIRGAILTRLKYSITTSITPTGDLAFSISYHCTCLPIEFVNSFTILRLNFDFNFQFTTSWFPTGVPLTSARSVAACTTFSIIRKAVALSSTRSLQMISLLSITLSENLLNENIAPILEILDGLFNIPFTFRISPFFPFDLDIKRVATLSSVQLLSPFHQIQLVEGSLFIRIRMFGD